MGMTSTGREIERKTWTKMKHKWIMTLTLTSVSSGTFSASNIFPSSIVNAAAMTYDRQSDHSPFPLSSEL
jgi:hypothetical protein